MLVKQISYNAIKQRQKSTGELSPKLPSGYLSDNNYNIERPLKSNSQNSTFKGLSFKEQTSKKKKKEDKLKPLIAMFGTLAAVGLTLRLAPGYKKTAEYSIREFLEFSKKHLGILKTDKNGNKIQSSIGEELFNHLKESKRAKNLIKIEGDKVTLYKKTIPQLIWDGLMYPFKILPADILNGTVKLIGKIKPFKKWAQKTLQKPLFKNIRQRSKIDAQANSLRGLFEFRQKELDKLVNAKKAAFKLGKNDELPANIRQEVLDELDKVMEPKMFRQSVKSFDPTKGQYDTKHERALNRIISGLPPAIFLANDAYNLSRMMDDDSKSASAEQKTRFKQEVARIGFNAYITLITLGALQKYINNSAAGIMLTTGATTLTTEAFSRLINGKHIKRLSPEEARAENAKNNAPEAKIKPTLTFKSKENKPKDDKQQKPLLSFDTVMKASAVIIAGGFGIKALRKIPAAEKQWKSFTKFFNNIYKNMTETAGYKVSKTELENINRVLKQHGYTDLAEKYERYANAAINGNDIMLGAKNKKIKPLINFIIAPFKFAWNTVTLPYNLTMKVINIFVKQPKKLNIDIQDTQTLDTIVKNFAKEKNIAQTEELSRFISDILNRKLPADIKLTPVQKELTDRISNISSLAKSIENIGREAKNKNLSPKEFQSYVNDNILKGFNADTMSNLPNSELSNLAKTAASIATIWFLMTDNYNMVMLKSNGNDVEGAKTKFTERFVQEGSRLFYQTLLIDLFNSTFRSQYNKSLFGMSWITLTNTTMGEWLTRKSVGVPVGTHSRDSLIKIEQEQENAKGFKKSYYNFMKRLTGKRSIKSYEVPAQNPVQNSTQNINLTTNTLDKMIKK